MAESHVDTGREQGGRICEKQAKAVSLRHWGFTQENIISQSQNDDSQRNMLMKRFVSFRAAVKGWDVEGLSLMGEWNLFSDTREFMIHSRFAFFLSALFYLSSHTHFL